MRTFLTLPLLIFCTLSFGQVNLDDSSTWSEGTGGSPGFAAYGLSAQNLRENATAPSGNQELVWKAIPSSTENNDGGWYGTYHPINPSLTYRITVWMKRTNSNTGGSYFGLNAKVDVNGGSGDNLSTYYPDGTKENNPYFFTGDLPELNTWYLLVGFIHGKDYNENPNNLLALREGKMYDINGNPIPGINIKDYKFGATSTVLRQKVLHINGTPLDGDGQQMYAPTFYEDNDQMPSITQLIAEATGNTNTPSGPSLWTQSGNNISYNSGNVGIGVTNPFHKLQVDGSIGVSSSIRIDNPNNPSAGLQFSWLRYNDTNDNPVDLPRIRIRGTGSGAASGFDIQGTGDTSWLRILNNGNIGMGTTNPGSYKLAVNGKIRAKEIKVETANWPDYVFAKGYKLPSLQEVEQHIKDKGHLPNVPSAKEVEQNGIQLGEMNKLLLEKIEELTLYLIELKKEIKILKNQTK